MWMASSSRLHKLLTTVALAIPLLVVGSSEAHDFCYDGTYKRCEEDEHNLPPPSLHSVVSHWSAAVIGGSALDDVSAALVQPPEQRRWQRGRWQQSQGCAGGVPPQTEGTHRDITVAHRITDGITSGSSKIGASRSEEAVLRGMRERRNHVHRAIGPESRQTSGAIAVCLSA